MLVVIKNAVYTMWNTVQTNYFIISYFLFLSLSLSLSYSVTCSGLGVNCVLFSYVYLLLLVGKVPEDSSFLSVCYSCAFLDLMNMYF